MILNESLDPKDEEVKRNLKLAKELEIKEVRLFDALDP